MYRYRTKIYPIYIFHYLSTECGDENGSTAQYWFGFLSYAAQQYSANVLPHYNGNILYVNVNTFLRFLKRE